MRMIAILTIIGDLMMDIGPMEEEDDITIEAKGCLIEGMTMAEVIIEEEDLQMIEDPLMDGEPPDDGGPPDDSKPPDGGGPPDDGGPPRNGRNPRCPGR